MSGAPALSFQPATAERWADLETLFGPRGACFGCWCMFHRLKRSVWQAQQGDASVAHKYLLLQRFWGGGLELIDLETGDSVFGKLKAATWIN